MLRVALLNPRFGYVLDMRHNFGFRSRHSAFSGLKLPQCLYISTRKVGKDCSKGPINLYVAEITCRLLRFSSSPGAGG